MFDFFIIVYNFSKTTPLLILWWLKRVFFYFLTFHLNPLYIIHSERNRWIRRRIISCFVCFKQKNPFKYFCRRQKFKTPLYLFSYFQSPNKTTFNNKSFDNLHNNGLNSRSWTVLEFWILIKLILSCSDISCQHQASCPEILSIDVFN